MSSLNSCEFIGNLGRDPEVKSTQSGEKVANLSIGVSERWKGRDGEKKERTTWVPLVIWGPLAEVAERYLRKGSKIFVRGKFSVRKWTDQNGNDRYSTEIVLQGPQAVLTMLDSPNGGQGGQRDLTHQNQNGFGGRGGFSGDQGGGWGNDLDDDFVPGFD